MGWELFKIIFTCALSFALGLVSALLVRHRERTSKNAEDIKNQLKVQEQNLEDLRQANNRLTMMLAQIEIKKAYTDFIDLDKPMSINDKRQIEELWHEYHDEMGGDGIMTPLYEALHRKQPYIVGGNNQKE